MSLVETTVVLAVVALLAAVAAPVTARSVDRAKLTRAVDDAKAIRTATLNWLTDMPGYTGFTVDGAIAGTTVEMLVSDGDIPRETSATGAAEWDDVVDNTTGVVDFLERHLVTNTPRGSAANDYPVSGSDIWRGAYLTAPDDPDPWGNRYAVNVKYLKDSPRSNDTFVMSAGPDEEIDSAFAVNGATPGDDDIIIVVRRDIGVTVP
jgi:type II secretory pathway pseudopilin PulG